MKKNSNDQKPKFKTFTDALNDEEGRRLIEDIEWGTSDAELLEQLIKNLEDYTGLTWIR